MEGGHQKIRNTSQAHRRTNGFQVKDSQISRGKRKNLLGNRPTRVSQIHREEKWARGQKR